MRVALYMTLGWLAQAPAGAGAATPSPPSPAELEPPPLLSIDGPPAESAGSSAMAMAPSSDDDRLAQAAATLERIQVALRVVLGKQQEARDTKDMVKLNCVTEKVTQLQALGRITDQAQSLMREAMASHDLAAEEHETLKVSIAGQKAEKLKGEADDCIGQLASKTDERATVEVVAPDGPKEDPTRPPNPDELGGRAPPAPIRPPAASPVD